MTHLIYIGDVHGEWGKLNTFINNKLKRIIPPEDTVQLIQCGDFGVWTPNDVMNLPIKLPDNYYIQFCRGNHDNTDVLKVVDKLHGAGLVSPHVHYRSFGKVLRLNDKNILFAGGAESIDKEWRKQAMVDELLDYDTAYLPIWWKDEGIDYTDIENLPDIHIDVVVSHCAPTKFVIPGISFGKVLESSRKLLDVVLDKYKPSEWYFGHYHKTCQGEYENTKWYCLNKINDTGFYKA